MAQLDLKKIDWIDRARFWSKVEVSTSISECWPWKGFCTRSGHGDVKLQGGSHLAHRVAYALATGEIPGDSIVRHQCDNPGCCNPLHLELGTHQDNVADRVRRKRSAYGEQAGRAKLTEDAARHILQSDMNRRVLARMYGVSVHTVDAVRQGKSWKHVAEQIKREALQ